MQMSMLIRQLDGFHPHKIRKLRANSNSNSKLELDVVGNSGISDSLLVDAGQEYQTYNMTQYAYVNFAFSALTLLIWRKEGHPACKN